jgi:hypothetical protein
MNLFEKAKNNQDYGSSNCFHCNSIFYPDKRNLNRGWGLFCSKSCSQLHLNKLMRSTLGERKQIIRDKKLRQLGI